MKTALTIAGSDSIGGAGIQADLKTMCAHHVYGMTVIAALTAQNTRGVQAIHTPPADFVRAQIDSVFSDVRPEAVKIGMLSNADVIKAVADALKSYHAVNIVVDPVMVSTSRCRLLEEKAEKCLVSELLPLADLVTPNLPEAEVLAGMPHIYDRNGMRKAARVIAGCAKAVLIKGGHLNDCSDDLLFADNTEFWFPAKRIQTDNTHGTGCTLSSAIACNLALGFSLPEAVKRAKDYITETLLHDPCIGHGNGPLDHLWKIAEI